MNQIKSITIIFLSAVLLLTACSSNKKAKKDSELEHNTLSKSEINAGWELLFDGTTLNGWRGLGRDTVQPDHWKVENGCIRKVNNEEVLKATDKEIDGGDLMTIEKFDNFEISFEWKIKKDGNSGIKYNVSEEISTSYGGKHSALGFEYQILDDDSEKYKGKLKPSQYTAGLYEMYKAENVKINPIGEFNRSRILLDGKHGEHWLNGVKVLEYEFGTAEFDSLFQKSKYHVYPNFEKKRKGHLVITNHSDDSWYRNIKIRRITK